MFKHKFFQQFPIVIVAAGHYPKNYNIDLEKIFNVKEGYDKDNVHFNSDRTKILIHTRQLSQFSYTLLKSISQIVREFIEKDLKQDIQKFLL